MEKCIICGADATKKTMAHIPTPVCDKCAEEEARKEWKRISFGEFNIFDYYFDIKDNSQENAIFANSLIRVKK